MKKRVLYPEEMKWKVIEMKKGQIDLQNQSVQNQKEFLHRVFGLIA